MVEQLFDSVIRHEFPSIKIIDHDADQAQKECEKFGFSPYITLTNKGIKKEGKEIPKIGELSISPIGILIEYQKVLIDYLESQNCNNGQKKLIWRKRPVIERLLDRKGYIVYSRLMII
jgi:hypothetical protein